jgi:hypothetical protein
MLSRSIRHHKFRRKFHDSSPGIINRICKLDRTSNEQVVHQECILAVAIDRAEPPATIRSEINPIPQECKRTSEPTDRDCNRQTTILSTVVSYVNYNAFEGSDCMRGTVHYRRDDQVDRRAVSELIHPR